MERRLRDTLVLSTHHHDAPVGAIDPSEFHARSNGTVVHDHLEARIAGRRANNLWVHDGSGFLDVASGFVANLHARPEPITKNVDDGSSMMRQHLGGTATHDAGAFGIGADDGDGLQPRGAER